MTAVVALLLLAALAAAVAGGWSLLAAREQQRLLAAQLLPDAAGDARLVRWRRLDRSLLRTRRGRALQDALTTSGITMSVGRFVALTAAVSGAAGLVLAITLSPLLLAVAPVLGVLGARSVVDRQRSRRREAFIAQMPELARTLSNATSAGLSVRTALALAADELAEPARSELRAVTEQLNLGASLDAALAGMERRLPSREVATLVTTLVVSARSGGGVVTALRAIAETLEGRKELRREIRTTYAQAVATGYFVLGLGVGVLFLIDRIRPGTVDLMLRSLVGQVALLTAAGIYAVGIGLIRRMTRVDV